MTCKIFLLLIVAMAAIAVAAASWDWEVTDLDFDPEGDEEVTIEDVEDFLVAKRNGPGVHTAFEDFLEVEKRRRKKVGRKCMASK
jgi:hypothetical protein